VEDVRSIGVETKIFKTDRIFNIGAFAVILILCILYKVLW
jgi:SSS family solute:Na+ symporter